MESMLKKMEIECEARATASLQFAKNLQAQVRGNSNEDENSEEEKENFRNLLKPFTAHQLFDILCDATMKDTQLLNNIRKLADKNPPHKILFVHGLHSNTTLETLKSIFSLYGELEECRVMMDEDLERSEGCAFVRYKHLSGAERALKHPCKKIDGRRTLCQLACDEQEQEQDNDVTRGRKIHVSNVPAYMPCLKLLNYFSIYGEIEEGRLGFDSKSGKLKVNGIFTYKTLEGAKKALTEPDKNVYGHYMHCTRATENQKQEEATQNNPLGRSDRAAAHGKDSIQESTGAGFPHFDYLQGLQDSGSAGVEVSHFDHWQSQDLQDFGSEEAGVSQFDQLQGLQDLGSVGPGVSQFDHLQNMDWDLCLPNLAMGASTSQHPAKALHLKEALLGGGNLQFKESPEAQPITGSLHYPQSQHEAILTQLALSQKPLTALPGLNAYKHGGVAGVNLGVSNCDYSSHATLQGQNAYQNQQLSHSTSSALPGPTAYQNQQPGILVAHQIQQGQQPAYQIQPLSQLMLNQLILNEQPSQAAAPALLDLTASDYVYSSQATQQGQTAYQNQQLSQSTSPALPGSTPYQNQQPDLQSAHQNQQGQ